MNTVKYVVRSFRYIIRMLIILGIVFAVMALAGLLETTQGNIWEIFISRNGLLLLGVLIILAGVYPKLAFGEVRINGNIHADRQKIKETMENYGFVPVREDEHSMVFHAAKVSRRIASQFDDAITITDDSGQLWMEGMKKDVLRIAGRLENSINGPEE